MRKSGILHVALGVLIVAAAAVDADAASVEFQFSGEIVFGAIPGSDIDLGDPFTGSLVWDTAQAGSAVTHGTQFIFSPPLAAPGARVRVLTGSGPVTLEQDPAQTWLVFLLDDAPFGTTADEIQYFGNLSDPVRNIQIRFRDTDATVFSGPPAALPAFLDLADWESASVTLTIGSDSARGTITSLTVVPEPGAGALFALGLIGVVARRRRR